MKIFTFTTSKKSDVDFIIKNYEKNIVSCESGSGTDLTGSRIYNFTFNKYIKEIYDLNPALNHNCFKNIQEDMIKACIHFHETHFKILIKEGLRLKGFEFQSDDEFYEFIKKECKLFYDKDLNMNFYVYSLIDKDIYFFKDWIQFLYIENSNKLGVNYNQTFDPKINFEIKYKFI